LCVYLGTWIGLRTSGVGSKCEIHLKETARTRYDMPLIMNEISERGKIFNWYSILSNSLEKSISKSQLDIFLGAIEFYMSSYLLEVICTSNTFMGLGLYWSLTFTFMFTVEIYGRTSKNFNMNLFLMASQHHYMNSFFSNLAQEYFQKLYIC
jgi:hypothetical protein